MNLLIPLLLLIYMAPASALDRSPLPDNSERQLLYPGGTRVLVIGLTRYTDPAWPELHGQRDAEKVRRLFLDRGISPTAITTVLPLPGDKATLEESLVRFGEQLASSDDEGSRVIIYIAGHGYTRDGIGYLVLPDAPDPIKNPVDFKVKALPVSALISRIAAFRAHHVLLVLDACFSGLALDSLPRERFAHPPPEPSRVRVLQVITAGTAGQSVSDDGRFADLLVSGLVGAADLNFDGWVSGTELGMYMRLRMTEITGGRQIPLFGNIILGRELSEGENWFASAQLPLQQNARPMISRDATSAAFRDCEDCPLLRVVTTPGASSKSADTYLAMGVHEVTFQEYDACFRAGGCSHWASSRSTVRGLLPVTDVSRHDAQTYARWLSCTTHETYRLPTDDEWLAAADSERNRLAKPSTISPANCVGCGGTGSGRSTLPVGSFAPSDYGLYDLVGNVWEWVVDCESKAGNPSCPQGMVRGGAFTTRRNIAVMLPRGELDSGTRDSNIGFRIVRELTGAPTGGQPWCTEASAAP